jgi:hypothetical protein
MLPPTARPRSECMRGNLRFVTEGALVGSAVTPTRSGGDQQGATPSCGRRASSFVAVEGPIFSAFTGGGRLAAAIVVSVIATIALASQPLL